MADSTLHSVTRRTLLKVAGASVASTGLLSGIATAQETTVEAFNVVTTLDCEEGVLTTSPQKTLDERVAFEIVGHDEPRPSRVIFGEGAEETLEHRSPRSASPATCFTVNFWRDPEEVPPDKDPDQTYTLCCPCKLGVTGSSDPRDEGGPPRCEWTFAIDCGENCTAVTPSVTVSFDGKPPVDSFTLDCDNPEETVTLFPNNEYSVTYSGVTNVDTSRPPTTINCGNPGRGKGNGKP